MRASNYPGRNSGLFFYNVLNDAGESYMLYTLSGAPAEAFSKFPMPRNTEIFRPDIQWGGYRSLRRYYSGSKVWQKPSSEGYAGGTSASSQLSRGARDLTYGRSDRRLIFGHSETGVFSERSERGLSGLAAEAAVAIDNARLTQATQKEILERKRTQEALHLLNENLELQIVERTKQLREKDEALRQSQKMEAVGQLTGGVAHDFNNLLQIIIGNLEALIRNLPSEPARLQRSAGFAMNGAQRAAALTQRLLAFSRRQPLDPKPIDINVLVSGMSELLHRTLGETIAIETVRGAGVWRVEVDPNEMEAAILNLAVNARDAMPNGGRLTIETANAHIDESYATNHAEVVPGQYVAIAVSDTGTGMDEATISQAFEPFFTTKPVGKGTGLGLSQVYGFVKQSGGHVKIYSEVGTGTTIKIYLPRWIGEQPQFESVSTPIPEGATEETVLVVEDDDDVRAHSVETLRELGYRVIEAHDGPSAIRLLERQTRVDLLFTDVVLPGGMTGAQVAAQACAVRPDLKVLFTTGYARNAIIHHGRLDKGVQLITKPFSYGDLAAKVRDVLDGLAD